MAEGEVNITTFDDAGNLDGTEKLYLVRETTDYNTTPDAIKTRVKGDIVNDLTTGGATKFASAETVKTLGEEKVDKVAGKSLILDTEISRLASVTNQTLVSLNALSYIPQSLTKEQQAQARENINAQDSNTTVYLNENEYQVLIDNDLVLPGVQYNIYEE